MAQYTGKYAKETMFPKWLGLVGGRAATSWDNVGGYTCDYNPIYGGVQIERIVTTGGGTTTVTNRMTPRQFACFVWDLEKSIEELKRNDMVLVS